MTAEEGGKAPNPKTVRLSDRSECHLLDLAKQGRPYVIIFGSITWPPFMARLERLRQVSTNSHEFRPSWLLQCEINAYLISSPLSTTMFIRILEEKKNVFLVQLMEDFAGVADFVLVYIAEAHPPEGWFFKGNFEISIHK